jgi:hypothetical protein
MRARYAGRVDVRNAPLPRAVTVAAWVSSGPDDTQHVGLGYVASDGRYGLYGHSQSLEVVGNEGLTVANLRAVWFAYGALQARGEPLDFLVHPTALSFLQTWQRGILHYPDGYLVQRQRGQRSTLHRLSMTVKNQPPGLSFESVRDTDLRYRTALYLARRGRRWYAGETSAGMSIMLAREQVEEVFDIPRRE